MNAVIQKEKKKRYVLIMLNTNIFQNCCLTKTAINYLKKKNVL